MKLSEINQLPSFALLGPGFTGGPFRLISPLKASDDPSVLFLPYESTAVTAHRWSGEERSIELEFSEEPPLLTPELRAENHADAVSRIREAIAWGDVYQVNYTVRAQLRRPTPEQLFTALCRRGTPTYMAWVRAPDGQEFISASPELFFTIEDGVIRSQPMKGTAAPDQFEALKTSEKDIAELAMITDLIRNDLTSVCEPGSVRVDNARRFLRLPYAVQAVSDVSGRLKATSTLDDVLNALHPGGSITGAPKNAARRMIAELETTPRGPYCGALGYRSRERTTFSLLIRTAVRQHTDWVYGVGGGIVWDSDADAELREIHIKLGALR